MRVLLFTGKGGVGKTTAAAATATLAANRGLKTLVLSTDSAHSLADAVDVQLGSTPTEIDTGLYGQQVDAQQRFEQTWREVQEYLVSLLGRAGVDPMEAEELTVLPGAEEVLALLEVRRQITEGPWDLLVVDCAPTAETLRLLALPEALNWYMDRVFPVERRLVRTLRPVLGRAGGLPLPQDSVFDAVTRLHAELGAVRSVLTDPTTSSIRLVLTPEAVVLAEARRTLTTLSLYGYRVDGVIANRVFPTGGEDAWRASWVAAQKAVLAEVDESFAGLPVYRSPYRAGEPIGLAELSAFAAEAYGDADVFGLPDATEQVTVERDGNARFTLVLSLPLAEKRDLQLSRRGDELVVTVGAHRRVLSLPSVLRRCAVDHAELVDGTLRIAFVPDPEQWMST